MKTIKLILILGIISNFFISSKAQMGYSSASVSQVRSNGLISSNQVVVEEYMNYHKHNIAQPLAGEEIALDLRWGNNNANTIEQQLVLQIGIATSSFDDYSQIPDLNICLVIDVSGSMSDDNRLEKLKLALYEFVQSLRPEDILSIVIYSDDAKTILPAQNVNSSKLIEMIISNMAPGGSTNLNAGMIMGYKEVMKNLSQKRTNKVILLTDGITNTGEINPEKIVKNSQEYNKMGIEISTIGVGYNVNFELLKQLAKNGKGSNHFIGSSGDIEKVFVNEVESLLSPVAKDVTIDIEFENSLSLSKIYGYSPKIETNKVHFEVDDINSCLTQIFLLEFNKQIKSQSPIKVNVSLNYLDIKTNKRKNIKKSIFLDGSNSKTECHITDPEVKKNYVIALMAQSLKDMALKYEANKTHEAQMIINDCLKEVYSFYPKPKDKDIKRVLEIIEKYKTPNSTYQGI